MSNDEFWRRVKHATELLNISNANFRKWKFKGFVPGDSAIKIHLKLKNTKNAVPLERFIQKP